MGWRACLMPIHGHSAQKKDRQLALPVFVSKTNVHPR
jgi:hypothetical protein